MNIYKVQFGGYYLTSYAVITAETPERAKEMMKVKLTDMGLSHNLLPKSFIPVEQNEERVDILFNEDY